MNSHPHHRQHGHDMTNSHLLVQRFDYHRPGSVEEALTLLSERGNEAAVLAGGTFLLVQMKMEQTGPECLVDIGGLTELCEMRATDRRLDIGSLVTIWSLRNAAFIVAGYTALADACAAFGSTQIQLAGTLGGNICSGSPASDTVPALMVLGAELLLVGAAGERVVPIEGFVVGPGKTAMAPGEILVGVRLPPPGQRAASAFVKISRVRADLAKASAAAWVAREGDRITSCRLAFGAVGPTVLRLRSAEEVLVGQRFSEDVALTAGRVASEGVAPIDDVRSSARYRRKVIRALLYDALMAAWSRTDDDESERTDVSERGLQAEAAGDGAGKRVRQQRESIHLGAGETRAITLVVNGVEHRLQVAPNELLINVLRRRLGLTGTKYGCGLGECGACTVHLDGVPTLSCLTLAVAAEGRDVTTVEGLESRAGELDPLQEAFIEQAAFQCGYCTPGILMMTKRLLAEDPGPSEEAIRDYLKGNRCRCTGFAAIVRAVQAYADDEAVALKTG